VPGIARSWRWDDPRDLEPNRRRALPGRAKTRQLDPHEAGVEQDWQSLPHAGKRAGRPRPESGQPRVVRLGNRGSGVVHDSYIGVMRRAA
jgi:hypothetical protein